LQSHRSRGWVLGSMLGVAVLVLVIILIVFCVVTFKETKSRQCDVFDDDNTVRYRVLVRHV